MVMSSDTSASAITGVAGRAMASGGGGISISGGSSMASSSSAVKETSSAVISGHAWKVPKCSTVAAIIEPQNRESQLRFRRSLAVSAPTDGRA